MVKSMQVLMKHYSFMVDRIWANLSCISSSSFLRVSGLAKRHSLPGAKQVDPTPVPNRRRRSSCPTRAKVFSMHPAECKLRIKP